MITVVIVDDSNTARRHLRNSLEFDPNILILGEAADGGEARRLVKKFSPDLVTMDVFLQNENGLDVAEKIMSETPRPIIVITEAEADDPMLSRKAMEVGALEVLPKLSASSDPGYPMERNQLIRLVRTLARVPVATRWAQRLKRAQARASEQGFSPRVRVLGGNPPSARPLQTVPVAPLRERHICRPQVLLIGASTGGPPVIGQLLKSVHKPLPFPVVVVQHISASFGAGFAGWLGDVSGLRAVFVEGPVDLKPGVLYVAPDEADMVFESEHRLVPVPRRNMDRISPSIDMLFNSAARVFQNNAVAVLLTGMGRDGAEGLKLLKDAGARTIVQSFETCAVSGMPNAAVAAGAACEVLPPPMIVDVLNTLSGQKSTFPS